MTTIVVGMDESPDAALALQWAVEECRLRAAELVVVHAWEWPYPGDLGVVADRALDELGFDGAAQRVLATMVDNALAGVARDVPLEQRAIDGSPVKALVAASAHADLLVVGARGRSGFERFILGSVSEHCAHRAHCPVLIMRRRQPPEG
jgi:nucleotide-binding universal stress UspA family protein